MSTPRDAFDVDALRAIARLGGFEWTDAELAEIRGAVEQMQRALQAMETVPLGETEPTAQYRML